LVREVALHDEEAALQRLCAGLSDRSEHVSLILPPERADFDLAAVAEKLACGVVDSLGHCASWVGKKEQQDRSGRQMRPVPACGPGPACVLPPRLLCGRPRLAATILALINLAIVIGPATWLGLSALDGVKEFAGNLGAGSLVVPSPPEGVKNWPLIGPQLYELWTQASSNIRAALREVAAYLNPLAGTLRS